MFVGYDIPTAEKNAKKQQLIVYSCIFHDSMRKSISFSPFTTGIQGVKTQAFPPKNPALRKPKKAALYRSIRQSQRATGTCIKTGLVLTAGTLMSQWMGKSRLETMVFDQKNVRRS